MNHHINQSASHPINQSSHQPFNSPFECRVLRVEQGQCAGPREGAGVRPALTPRQIQPGVNVRIWTSFFLNLGSGTRSMITCQFKVIVSFWKHFWWINIWGKKVNVSNSILKSVNSAGTNVFSIFTMYLYRVLANTLKFYTIIQADSNIDVAIIWYLSSFFLFPVYKWRH